MCSSVLVFWEKCVYLHSISENAWSFMMQEGYARGGGCVFPAYVDKQANVAQR